MGFSCNKNYKIFLEDNESSYIKILPDLLKKALKLESISSPFEIVFSDNDLLPANFIQNQEKICLIDWEYAGFNNPLFDLVGLTSNTEFDHKNYTSENLSKFNQSFDEEFKIN